MLAVPYPSDLLAHVGTRLEPSNWITIDQTAIDRFGEVTLDLQWIHVDPERARREAPMGTTIAHGYMLLSLLAGLVQSALQVERRSRGVNYGLNRVRFLSPVPVGSRVRAIFTIEAVEPVSGGVRAIMQAEIEVDGSERPALVAETITLHYD